MDVNIANTDVDQMVTTERFDNIDFSGNAFRSNGDVFGTNSHDEILLLEHFFSYLRKYDYIDAFASGMKTAIRLRHSHRHEVHGRVADEASREHGSRLVVYFPWGGKLVQPAVLY